MLAKANTNKLLVIFSIVIILLLILNFVFVIVVKGDVSQAADSGLTTKISDKLEKIIKSQNSNVNNILSNQNNNINKILGNWNNFIKYIKSGIVTNEQIKLLENNIFG